MMYKNIKRILDLIISIILLIILSPVLLLTAIMVRFKLGNPIIFSQYRPGIIDSRTGKEHIFRMYKFRTMTDEHNQLGELLPDEKRLTKFGLFLRKTSLDELPELWNVAIGNMSLIGPRPLLVRDMVFMSKHQRERHNVKPGITGLAQVSGRNEVDWIEKLDLDLVYINNVSFKNDIKILFKTVRSVFKQEGITEEGRATATDLGDYLLSNGKVSFCEYKDLMNQAKQILEELNE